MNTELPAGALNQPRGFILEGICKGCKTKERVDDETGEVKKTIYAGLAIPVPDGFDDEIEIIQVKIPDNLVSKGFPAKYVQHKQDIIQIPIRVTAWKMGTRSGVSYGVLSEEITVTKKVKS